MDAEESPTKRAWKEGWEGMTFDLEFCWIKKTIVSEKAVLRGTRTRHKHLEFLFITSCIFFDGWLARGRK